jgi:diguanylate cyclase (GGDEF)-like protein
MKRSWFSGLRFALQLAIAIVVLVYCVVGGANQIADHWYLALMFTAGFAATTAMPFSVVRAGSKAEFSAATMVVVPCALTLPTQASVLIVAAGVALAWVIRRDLDLTRLDDISGDIIAAFVALAAAHVVGQVGLTARDIAGATVSALIFDPLSLFAVAFAIWLSKGLTFWSFIWDCIRQELAVWPLMVSIGILLGALATSTPWTLPLAAAPLALIFLASRARVEATEDRTRLNGLLGATTAILEATTIAAVTEAASDAAASLFEGQGGRIDTEPARESELGALLVTELLGELHLVVRSRASFMPHYTDQDQRLLETLASITASALDKAVQHEDSAAQATTDALTGLANRRSFEAQVALALNDRRSSDDSGVIFVDLDRFKQINDEYGHKAGDEVLVETASRLIDAVRGGDVVARLGGDEFTILLRGVHTVGDAVLVAERVLSSMRHPIVLSNGVEVNTTPSIGIALATEPGMDPVQLLKDADEAMYEAKRAGKDCYCVARAKFRRPMVAP